MIDLVGMLMIGTLGFAAAFAWINARTTQKLKGKMPKSTLARDSHHWREARLRAAARG